MDDDSLNSDGLRSFESVGSTGRHSRFFTALVRFNEGGRTYPVNCSMRFRPGERVLVRMDNLGCQLKEATVVKNDMSYNPCKNGVVCLASEAENYGPGPAIVKDCETLEAFMKKQGWQKFKLSPDARTKEDAKRLNYLADVLALFEEWPFVYMRRRKSVFSNACLAEPAFIKQSANGGEIEFAKGDFTAEIPEEPSAFEEPPWGSSIWANFSAELEDPDLAGEIVCSGLQSRYDLRIFSWDLSEEQNPFKDVAIRLTSTVICED